MMGIFFLTILGLWIIAAVALSYRIPRWLGIKKHPGITGVLLFPLVAVFPVADDLIGRWQFDRLCEREAVVTLSPDWEKVKRARNREIPTVNIDGYFIPIRSQRMEYFDVETGKTFYTRQAFHMYGGFLMGRFGQNISCWPKEVNSTSKKINLDRLLNKGEMK